MEVSSLEFLAEQALIVLVGDHGYSNDIPCRYGHHPLRHSILWDAVERALGKERMAELVDTYRRCAEAERQQLKFRLSPCNGRFGKSSLFCELCGHPLEVHRAS